MLPAVRRAALVPPALRCCGRVLDTWEVALLEHVRGRDRVRRPSSEAVASPVL